MSKKVRSIKNVSHDLLPIIGDLKSLTSPAELRIEAASDLIKHMREIQKCVFLVENYLLQLDKEAGEHGIEKVEGTY